MSVCARALLLLLSHVAPARVEQVLCSMRQEGGGGEGGWPGKGGGEGASSWVQVLNSEVCEGKCKTVANKAKNLKI